MEEVVRAFLSSSVGKTLFVVLIVIVGSLLREWTYRNRYGYNNTWSKTRGADLRREEKERRRLQKEIRKKYAYLNKNSSNRSKSINESISSKILSWIKRNFITH